MFTQLHTRVIVSEGKPLFQLTLGTKPFEKATILEFEFPLMNTTVLKEMIEGNDAEDQNDDGFFIRMEDETVSIKIYRESDSSESKSVDITLPFVVCKQAFLDLLPLYEAEDSRLDESGSEKEIEAAGKGMKSSHCDFCEGEYVISNLYIIRDPVEETKIICHYCKDDMRGRESVVMVPMW